MMMMIKTNELLQSMMPSETNHNGNNNARASKRYSSLFYTGASAVLIVLLIIVWMVGSYDTLSHHSAEPQNVGVETTKLKHTAAILFLHGLGDTSAGSPQMVLQAFSQDSYIRFITPTAKVMHVSANNGKMHSWFDIFGLSADSQEDAEGIKAAAREIESLIDEVVASGIPRSCIILGGFSQGGALTLYTAFTSVNVPLAGVLAMSTWLPLLKTFPQSFKGNRATPFLQTHGNADKVVAFSFGQKSYDVLKAYNGNAQFKEYEGQGHTITQQELVDVRQFVLKCLSNVEYCSKSDLKSGLKSGGFQIITHLPMWTIVTLLCVQLFLRY